jgi:hypothetical protein
MSKETRTVGGRNGCKLDYSMSQLARKPIHRDLYSQRLREEERRGGMDGIERRGGDTSNSNARRWMVVNTTC